MPGYKKKPNFFDTEESVEFIKSLKLMAADSAYHTKSSYSTNSDLYPGNQRSFEDTHIDYMRSHPTTDPNQYLANLRLMTRVR